MYKRFLLFFIGFILLSPPSHSYAQRSIGQVETATKSKNILDLPVQQWIGKKFVFPEKPKSSQKFGYYLWLEKGVFPSPISNREFQTDFGHLKYEKFVGKTIRVIDLENMHNTTLVVFIEEQSGIKIYGKPHKGCINDIVFLDDMKNAKEKWLGKTIYSKRRSIRTYDAKSDKYGEVKVGIVDPLKVIDVWWGFSSNWPKYGEKGGPLWVIVETTKGEKGFIPTALSWTNIYEDRWSDNRPWDDDFSYFNPKGRFKWSDEMWELINIGKVRVGMNKEQVKLSWGKPKKINKDIFRDLIHEQWVYGNQCLYFENDKLTTIQSH